MENEPRQLRGVKLRRFQWTNQQTEDLLQSVVTKVQKGPEGFEKPTIYLFYESLVKEYGLKDLENLGPAIIRNKMKNLKDSYAEALDWIESSGQYLLRHGDEKAYKEQLNQICLFYDLLHKIYGPKSAENSFYINENDVCVEINPIKSEKDNHELEQSHSYEEIHEVSNREPEEPQEPGTSRQFQNSNPSKRPRITENPTTTNITNNGSNLKQKYPFIDDLSRNQEKIMEIKEKKLESQIASERRRSEFEAGMLELKRQKFNFYKNMEEKRFELERSKVTGELELRKVEIEKEYDLKKFELQLKYNTANNNK